VIATTVFDARLANGLPGVVIGSTLEVFGFFDAASSGFVATRIEPRSDPVALFKVRGPVQALDTTAMTFTIGAELFHYTVAPTALANGAFVRVQVETTPVAGRWEVRAFGDGVRRLPDLDRARLRGPITTFVSVTEFSVNGQPVDASAATLPAGLALGARVEVEGAVVAGVLKATEVELDDDGGEQGDFELKGAIQSHDLLAQTFVLRDVTVFYGGADVQFDDGTLADIGVGVEVEVRGALSTDGQRLLATRIRFRD